MQVLCLSSNYKILNSEISTQKKVQRSLVPVFVQVSLKYSENLVAYMLLLYWQKNQEVLFCLFTS